MNLRILAGCLLAVCLGAGGAAPPALTLDEAFGTAPPWGAQPSHVQWAPDGTSFLYDLPSQNPFQALPVRQYDTRTGQSRVLIDPKNYGAGAHTAADIVWSPHSRRLAFVERGTLYVRDMATNMDRLVAKGVDDPQWSPNGTALAYVHGADIYIARLGPKLHVERLTAGGVKNTILNGGLDWVYPEELGTEHGFAWSPNGREIAYMRMDERPVTNFPIVDFLKTDNTVAYQRYPLAGEKNPAVSLRVVQIAARKDRLVYDAAKRDEYLPFFGWRPRSHTLVAEVLDRAQQHLRVVAWNRPGAAAKILYRQSDPKWVDDIPLPTWLPGGSSAWVLDRDGTTGLYLRARGGKLTRLTGAYHVFGLDDVDAKDGIAYLTAAYPSRRDRSLLAVPLSGGAPKNLTPDAGSHVVALSPTYGLLVDTSSTLNAPPQTALVQTNDGMVRAILAQRDAALQSMMLPVQMLHVDSAYGKLDATMMKPPNFNAAQKYPVIVYVYGGPAAPTTMNAFGGQFELYAQLLAQQGAIVFSIDGPASQLDSDAHVRLLYHNFGPGSLLGQQIGVNYLRSLAYVDPGRIGIWGWSFGGYETIYALTHSRLFKAGAAVAPVTDWHLYDTIYTERYMGLPQNDPKAYDASSDLKAVPELSGHLLISHGTSDDNVHMANTIALLQACIDADKTGVDFFAYPQRTHSIAGVPQRRQLFGHMLAWWKTHL